MRKILAIVIAILSSMLFVACQNDPSSPSSPQHSSGAASSVPVVSSEVEPEPLPTQSVIEEIVPIDGIRQFRAYVLGGVDYTYFSIDDGDIINEISVRFFDVGDQEKAEEMIRIRYPEIKPREGLGTLFRGPEYDGENPTYAYQIGDHPERLLISPIYVYETILTDLNFGETSNFHELMRSAYVMESRYKEDLANSTQRVSFGGRTYFVGEEVGEAKLITDIYYLDDNEYRYSVYLIASRESVSTIQIALSEKENPEWASSDAEFYSVGVFDVDEDQYLDLVFVTYDDLGQHNEIIHMSSYEDILEYIKMNTYGTTGRIADSYAVNYIYYVIYRIPKVAGQLGYDVYPPLFFNAI